MNRLILILWLFNPWIEKYSAECGIHSQISRGILFIESYGDPAIESYAGARGLMQIMPGTARYISNLTGWNAEQILNDPETNVRAGIYYFSIWYYRFNDLDKALASYYGGPGHVIDCDCVPPFTQHYVDKARSAMGWNWPSVICARRDEACLREID